MRELLCFFVQHMLTHERIILRQLKTRGGVTAILERVVHVAAFAAAKFDQNAIAFFRHCCDALSLWINNAAGRGISLTSL